MDRIAVKERVANVKAATVRLTDLGGSFTDREIRRLMFLRWRFEKGCLLEERARRGNR